jgi:hypothetical protein
MAVCFTLWWGLDANSKILGFSWLAVGIVYLAILTKFFKQLPPSMTMQD